MIRTGGRLASIDERELRELCGGGVFHRADLLERAGHVMDPSLAESTIRALVRGTWRRTFRTVVEDKGGRLSVRCSCAGKATCTHGAALLLHWIRHGPSFLHEEESLGTEASQLWEAAREESFAEELARLLESDTATHLREIGRHRGIKLGARSKAELIGLLAEALADAARVDEGLAMLDADGRLSLDALHLAAARGGASAGDVERAYRILGGAGSPDLERLVNLGLAVAKPGIQLAYSRFLVPAAVGARLPTLEDLFEALPLRLSSEESKALAEPLHAEQGAGIVELLMAVGLEVSRGGVRRRDPEGRPAGLGRSEPKGWRIDPAELPELTTSRDLYYSPHHVHLLPRMPSIQEEDLNRLAAATGQGIPTVHFALGLLSQLGAVGGDVHLALREDRFNFLLGDTRSATLARLSAAWVAMSLPIEMEMAVGEGGPLQLRYNVAGHGNEQLLSSEVAAARGLVARVVGRMAPGPWHDLDSFRSLLVRLAPDLLSPRSLPFVRDRIRITAAPRSESPLLQPPQVGLEELRDRLLSSVLTGPLNWLGLVDVRPRGDHAAFRVRPEAVVLVGRAFQEPRREVGARLVVSPRLEVLVQSGVDDPEVRQLLVRAGELIGVSPEGVRYQLTPDRVQGLFDAGVSGPELARTLADRSGPPLPGAAVDTIERWWEGYGRLRVYDDLTLIELGDDYLLPELLAATSLGSFILHRFSPRLIAVDPASAADLLAELTRLGHSPRVVEDC